MPVKFLVVDEDTTDHEVVDVIGDEYWRAAEEYARMRHADGDSRGVYKLIVRREQGGQDIKYKVVAEMSWSARAHNEDGLILPLKRIFNVPREIFDKHRLSGE